MLHSLETLAVRVGPSLFVCLVVWTGAMGLVALVWPRGFQALAQQGSRWVDSQKLLAVFDNRIDIDQRVLPFSRLLGLAAVAASIYLAVRFWPW